MEPNQYIHSGGQRSAIPVSGKLFNNDDGPIRPTEGRVLALPGHRHVLLVAGQAAAGNTPRQQTWKSAQMTRHWLKGL